MKKYWVENLKELQVFTYVFMLPVEYDNYIEKILKFDQSFIKFTQKYKILYVLGIEEDQFISQYFKARNKSFFATQGEFNRIRLLDFEQCDVCYPRFGLKDLQTPIPEIVENDLQLMEHVEHRPFGIKELFYINNTSYLSLQSWEKNGFKKFAIAFSITSYSNIWWDELDITILEGHNYRSSIEPAINNRPFAYRITPRLNSLMRDLKHAIEEINGSMIIDEYDPEHVTNEGILLDGHVIYQEDIDEGRVQLPN